MQGVEGDCQHKQLSFLLLSVEIFVILDINSDINCRIFGREAGSLFCG